MVMWFECLQAILLRRLVAEGAGEDESADTAFRVFAVNTYLKAGSEGHGLNIFQGALHLLMFTFT